MKVFVCTDHEGFYPVGCASVVLASSQAEARALLKAKLVLQGLRKDEPFTLRELPMVAAAYVLNDWDY